MKKIFLFSILSCALALAPFAQAEIAPGTLVMCLESPDVYVVSDQYANRLNLLRNEISFLSHGYQWGDVVNVSCEEIAAYSVAYQGFDTEKLLKFVGSPEVYEDRIDCSFASSRTSTGCTDIFYHIENEVVAAEMFGDDWEMKIIEVPEVYRESLYLNNSGTGLILH